jgi:spore coat protein U-like protein
MRVPPDTMEGILPVVPFPGERVLAYIGSLQCRLALIAVMYLLLALTTQITARAACADSATISATPLAFNNVNPFALPSDSTATITIVYTNSNNACTESGAVATLSVGTGSGATAAIRKMTSGANTLNYTIYSDAARTTVWDNVTGYGLPSIAIGKKSTATQTATAYGRVLTGQSNAAVASNYADSVTMTLTF